MLAGHYQQQALAYCTSLLSLYQKATLCSNLLQSVCHVGWHEKRQRSTNTGFLYTDYVRSPGWNSCNTAGKGQQHSVQDTDLHAPISLQQNGPHKAQQTQQQVIRHVLQTAHRVPTPHFINKSIHTPQQHHQQQQVRQLHLAPPFLVEDYIPAAVTTYRLGRMSAKLQAADKELQDCRVCPRDCGVNRLNNELGVCNVGRKMLVSTIAPHFAEEAPLQGWNGSGTVFFSMCNLRCVFCQNWDISQKRAGFELSGAELADWMIKLQDFGKCHNINLVTPEHVAPQIVEAVAAAVEKGLNVPIIYNTSAYDGLPSLKLMDGLVDIYMPDFKFWSSESSRRYAKAKDYPETARAAIKEMHRQVGDLVFSADGLAKRGLLLRHLVMPGLLDEGKSILDWVVKVLGRDTFVHIMEQYTPRYLVGSGEQRSRDGWVTYDEVNKRPTGEEVQELKQYARDIGLWRFEEMAQWETGELAG